MGLLKPLPPGPISIIVLAYNKLELTQRCVQSILEGATRKHQLIIVDNASSDETPQWIESFRAAVESRDWTYTPVRAEKNRGVSAGYNLGIAVANHPWIALVNNDTWLMPQWDEALLKDAIQLDTGMISPAYDEAPFSEDATDMITRARKYARRNRRRHFRRWGSIFMLFRKEVFDRIGPYDDAFFVTSEDNDFRHRMELAKIPYHMTGACYCWHFSKGTRGSDPRNSEYEQQGREIFKKKWGFDPRTPEHTFTAKLLRRWNRIKAKWGYL